MIRTQVSLAPHAYASAKKEAKRLSISVAELVRRALQSTLPVESDQPWMGYRGLVASGDAAASQRIDEVVYGHKD